MTTYNLIAATSESTVVAEYTPEGRRSDSYQSEAALEQEFIRLLQGQGYEYLSIHSEGELIANLRRQLELLNHYSFTDSEWDRFFKTSIAGANDGNFGKDPPHTDRPRAGAAAGQRDLQKHLSAGQKAHPQQPFAGHQPV